jgi:Kae1-associated kinase Bud32
MKIAQGAEAVISKEDGKILKDRIKKNYRITQIDIPLRKQRTRTEAKLLAETRRAGVPTPQVLEVSETKIVMEEIKGETLKILFTNPKENKRKSEIAYNIGQLIARLHKAGIVHGDLTSSNIILRAENNNSSQEQAINNIIFIDFGLGFFSSRTEDYAQDLAVLKEALQSTHFSLFNQLWKEVTRGYGQWSEASKVFKVLKAIETRGRYIKRR